ncbi:sulfite exporter TauE/SafE family protein [Massilia pseudoviolaceinigra]|uniref:sulfite exporter TauE/SafE family protein n=1 Tax=Massilia pseudoviolaceinigra TaxID=3057165 RepID=UPI002796CA2D|nr:sulfite exporter TauE/SafE family protein [Massilia sp. CCM 9206]MDQ1923999.1 sulfite exporter TauE/SafE family protein [Massilia sp. CCM 9206]
MTALSLIPVFMVGLLGSVHCVGMCGGIVSAFSAAPVAARPFPVAVMTQRAATDGMARVLAYNTGRIASYMTAGALAGGIAGGARTLAGLTAVQAGGYWLANLMLVILGLYLMDAWRGLAKLEALGQGLWQRARPLMRFIVPIDRPLKMLALGALWGWLPCGMVYSVLMTAMFTGSGAGGAIVMLAFGLGTLPMLLAMGMAGERLRAALQKRAVRLGAGTLVLAFGLLGLVRAAIGGQGSWLDALCITGGVH